MTDRNYNPDLFATFAERAMQRLDEVVRNAGCPWPISVDQYEMLKIMRPHQGISHAISLITLCAQLSQTLGRGVSAREVKDLVQDLRLNFGVQIAASRDSEAGGYFIAATQQEIEDAITPMWKQSITMLRVCRAMRGPQHTAAELAGQVRLELEKEADQ